MSEEREDIKASIKSYIMQEFLPDDDPESLADDTPLISSAVLDSIATVKLASFLEEQYGVELQPHEMGVDYLNTLAEIMDIVEEKLGGGS